MAKTKSFAEALQGGLLGGMGGAQAGAAVGGGPGAAAGGLLGLLGGGAAGFLDAQANAPFDALNMQEQRLTNDELAQKLQDLKRKNRTAQTMENGLGIFRNLLGAGFKSNAPTSFGAALKAYPGLGNQGTP